MKRIKLLTIAAVMMGLVSCQKEDSIEKKDNSPAVPTKQDLLSAHAWGMTAMTIDPPMMGVTDLYPMIDACEKDNTWEFVKDASKTLKINEGANVCSGRSPQKLSNWSLDKSETSLVMDKDTFTLISVSTDKLLTQEHFTDGGKPYVITITHSAR